MRLSKKRAIALHRELWDWLYRHPSLKIGKKHWPEWKWNGGKYCEIMSNCFLCEYTYECLDCPLDWSEWARTCSDWHGGLFTSWKISETWQNRKKYAKLIRDLKEKK